MKARHVNPPRIAKRILGQAAGVNFQLMRLQIHVRIKNDKLLLQTFSIRTQEVFLLEMHLERMVVDIVLLLSAPVTTIANVTALMLISAMQVELVVTIETL